jgi:hypothetical protein
MANTCLERAQDLADGGKAIAALGAVDLTPLNGCASVKVRPHQLASTPVQRGARSNSQRPPDLLRPGVLGDENTRGMKQTT